MADQVYLRSKGQSILIDLTGDDPTIVYWGADLGEEVPDGGLFIGAVANSMFDEPVRAGVVPQASRGWRGRPGVSGGREGAAYSPRFALTAHEVAGGRVTLRLSDELCGLDAVWSLALEVGGLLVADLTITNTGETPYALSAASIVLPVPDHAVESFDLTGRWLREKHPQRRQIDQGTWVRSGRHGRTGHDATGVIAAGSTAFGWRHGEVWALHLGWSGDHDSWIERGAGGQGVLGVAELLAAGEIVLPPGERYVAPTAYAAYSDHGLDGISERFYEWMRARPGHPSTPRPVVLNTWEAVYFAHDLTTLTELAEVAASVGTERFVLDDGWFHGRRNDLTSLGDWYVDEAVWPGGLPPLADHVHGLGMQFGLWVEPEMINEDSDLARAHPDWIAGPAGRRSLDWRNQQVLDLVNPAAFAFILERLDALVAENRVDYLKWDQNRDQLEAGHDGTASAHRQTLAAYRLLDELRARHPDLEIESCSSGGARVDLGILARTDRLWASDTNDALERQTIQRYTQLLVPPELVGAHVGPTRSHSTGRVHDLSFRAATALVGHFGMEWDIRETSEPERRELAWWIAFYKEQRSLLHRGRMVRVDHPDPTAQVHGVVAQDGSRAVFVWATLATSPFETPVRVRFPGLTQDRRYRVILARPVEEHRVVEHAPPPWLDTGVDVTGRVLGDVGLPMPVLHPEHALVFTLTAVT